jgi:hypothetical protein
MKLAQYVKRIRAVGVQTDVLFVLQARFMSTMRMIAIQKSFARQVNTKQAHLKNAMSVISTHAVDVQTPVLIAQQDSFGWPIKMIARQK